MHNFIQWNITLSLKKNAFVQIKIYGRLRYGLNFETTYSKIFLILIITTTTIITHNHEGASSQLLSRRQG